MSYYNPLQSQYEKQRLNLELSIRNLQEKLRKVRGTTIDKYCKCNTYGTRQKEMHMNYIARLQAIRAREIPSHTGINSIHRHSMATLNYAKPLLKEDDEEDLVEKYENGTKVKQYNDQLDKFKQIVTDRKLQRHSVNDNGILHATQHHPTKQFQSNQYSTPYDILKKSGKGISTPSKYELKGVKQNLKDKFIKQPDSFIKEPDTIFTRIQHKDKSDQLTGKSKLPSPLKPKHHNLGPSKSRRAQSTRNLTKHEVNSNSNNKDTNIKRQVSTIAGKKIENRLKLSQVIFSDSKFKNIKYEQKHLHMTYQNELKVRRQMQQKLNHHPSVLRKHALVL